MVEGEEFECLEECQEEELERIVILLP